MSSLSFTYVEDYIKLVNCNPFRSQYKEKSLFMCLIV